jgi:hypothetical protein
MDVAAAGESRSSQDAISLNIKKEDGSGNTEDIESSGGNKFQTAIAAWRSERHSVDLSALKR